MRPMPRKAPTQREEGKLKKAEPMAAFSAPPSAHAPSREEVAKLAYELYLSRGGDHGHDLEDWLEAERQLRRARTRS